MPNTHRVRIRRQYVVVEWSFFASECSIAYCHVQRWRRIDLFRRVILQSIAKDWRRNWNHCSMLICHRCCCNIYRHLSWPSLDRQRNSRSRMPCKGSTAWTGSRCGLLTLSVGSWRAVLAQRIWICLSLTVQPFVSCSLKLSDFVSYMHSFLKI